MSGNLFLAILVDLHWAITGNLFCINGPPISGAASRANARSHTQVADALRRVDGPAAASVMREHHDAGEHRFIRWLDSQPDRRPGGEQAVADALVAAMLWSEARLVRRAGPLQ